MADFSQLIEPEDEDALLETMLGVLRSDGFPVLAWIIGSAPRSMHKAIARVLADVWLTIALIARGATLETSTRGWLTLLAASQYGLSRLDPVTTIGTVVLTDGGGGPHVIAVGQLYVATVGGVRFRNTSSGTLPASGTLELTFAAEFAGSAANVTNGAIGVLVTSLPTVSVSNPAIGTTGTWITTLGADQESDPTLRARCSAKWATLSTGSPAAAYIFWALSIAGTTRAAVDDGNPDGAGTLRVYIDSAANVTSTQDYVQDTTSGGKAPSGSLATIVAATTVSISVPGVVTIQRAYRATAEPALLAALAAYALEVPIGGIVREAEVVERVMTPVGVVDFVLGAAWTGTPNIQLTPAQIPQFTTASLSIVEV